MFIIQNACLLLVCLVYCTKADESIVVGLLTEDSEEHHVFTRAVRLVNEATSQGDLKAIYSAIDSEDSFQAIRDVCLMVDTSAIAIFGPASEVSSVHVSSVCGTLGIPHVQLRWDTKTIDNPGSINLYPNPEMLAKAYTDLMKYWKWEEVAFVYEHDDDVVDNKQLLQEMREDGFEIRYFRRNVDMSFRDILRHIRDMNIAHIVVELEEEQDKIENFLKQAMQMNMLNEYYAYLFLSLDFHVADLEDFAYSGANITALRIVDVKHPELSKMMEAPQLEIGSDKDDDDENAETTPPPVSDSDEEPETSSKKKHMTFPPKIETEVAMMYDAVKLFSLGLSKLDNWSPQKHTKTSCAEPSVDNKHLITNAMKDINFDGMTGHVDFDEKSLRTEFRLYVSELGSDGLEDIGIWSATGGLNITQDENEDEDENGDDFLNDKELTVVSVLSRPFLMRINDASDEEKEEDDDSREENEEDSIGGRYEGFVVDLLDEIRKDSAVRFRLYLSPDQSYGIPLPNGSWKGMIGEVMSGRADLAVSDLTMTETREGVVDFTLPFMKIGLTVVTKATEPRKPGGIWAFFLPLTREVWVYTIVAMGLTTLVLYICARLSFSEWVIVPPIDSEHSETVQNNFDLYNAFWYTLSTLLHQRANLDPSATATRILGGFWYFFTFIILALLASNMCYSMLWVDEPITYTRISDIMRLKNLKLAALKYGSTRVYLKQMKHIDTIHHKISDAVERHGDNLPSSTNEGIEQVKQGYYTGYVMESAAASYNVQHDCNLTQTKPFVFHSSYGIAVKRGSPLRNSLSSTLLRLQESGRLQWLVEKYWKPQRYCDTDLDGSQDDRDKVADDEDENADHDEEDAVELHQLTVGDLSGAFTILWLGLLFALIVAALELAVIFGTREKRDTHLNMMTVKDHLFQALFLWKEQIDLTEININHPGSRKRQAEV